jgi:hypothetical protein
MTNTFLPNTISIDDAVKSILQREGDTLGNNLMKYLSVAKDIYRDLNLQVIRETKRVWVEIDKKHNTLTYPDDFIFLSSISVEDECGILIPLVINTNLKNDIIDISQEKDCHCDCGCSSELCGKIKNYELVTETKKIVFPNGSYTWVTLMTRKKINSDGSLVIERLFPKFIYENGLFVDYEMVTEEEFICKLDVNNCGCIKQTNDNVSKVKTCCGDDFENDFGCTKCNQSSSLSYNVSDGGNRIVFPSSFHFEKVLLRYFCDLPKKELRIPIIAKQALMYGIKHEIAIFDKKEPELVIRRFASLYAKEKSKLRTLLNRYSLKNFYDVVLGNKKMV